MQSVKIFCCLYLLILALPFSLSAQVNLVPDKIYFQNEIIRKVSVGDGGVWVIKGADSTGVGKLEPDGRELDYTQTVNSSFPLTGIVGKYGDSAMIATKGNYLLMYDRGKISRMDEGHGIRGNIINEIAGSPGFTRLATNSGAFESHDNSKFYILQNSIIPEAQNILRTGKHGDYLSLTYISKYGHGYCSDGDKNTFHIYLNTHASTYKSYFLITDSLGLNTVATNRDGSYRLSLFLGSNSGLRTRSWECGVGKENRLLQDTAVYVISKFKEIMLIGTEKGLFYSSDYYPQKVTQIALGDEYKIFDITENSKENKIWLATDKGLLELKEPAAPEPKKYFGKTLMWEKNIEGSSFKKVNSSGHDHDGNLFITGTFSGLVNFGDSVLIAKNSGDYYLAKYNPEGKLLWLRTALNATSNGSVLSEEGKSLRVNSKGEVFVILDVRSAYDPKEKWEINFDSEKITSDLEYTPSYMLKYGQDGTFLKVIPFEYHYLKSDTYSWDIDQYGNLFFSVYDYNNPFKVKKYNKNLNLLWEKEFPAALNTFKLNKSGAFYLTGNFSDKIEVGNLVLQNNKFAMNVCYIYFDKDGNPLWGKAIETKTLPQISKIRNDRQGNIYVSGNVEYLRTINQQPMKEGYFYAKLNPVGEFEWVINGPGADYQMSQIEVDSLGNSFLAGTYNNKLIIGNEVILEAGERQSESYILKINPDGKLSWAQALPGNFGSFSLKGKDLYLSNNLPEKSYSVHLKNNFLVAKIKDTTSYQAKNLVRGKVFFDKNNNNNFDQGDAPVTDNFIKALPGPVYAKPDHDGNYFLYLNSGQYIIEQIIPQYKGKTITQTFPARPYQLNLPDTKADTAGFDFAHDVQLSPLLSVDVSSTRFRRCFTNNTVVEYCNDGFAAAENVQIELEYPEYVIPVSSDFAWSSKNGKKLLFNIGTLQAGQCKSITLTDSVMCGNESIRGLTQCIKASITPLPSTITNPEWDQSDIELAAECKDNGFVRLSLRNNGNGDMADSAVFRIFLQDALSYTGKYKLKKEEDLSLNVLANGKPLHLEAELSPFHPQKTSVSISIHGCDEDGNPTTEHTYTNQFPQNDDQDHYETSCLEILDSYDPNDKQVIPAGISASHYVAEESLLEYTIRFQNTGTDTAYTVVINDILDPNLDISTLHTGLSSHPVKWDLSGEEQATISWRFDKINLPDSTTNEKASHGFVKFKIKAKPDAGFGTAIKNKAAIYFDYNSPIITNETLTTLGIPENTSQNKITLQNCNVSVSLQQEEDAEIILCETGSLQLSRMAPKYGRGRWRILKGKAKIADLYSHNSMAEDISYGENIFQWEVSYCDAMIRSNVIVKREALPAAPEVNPVPDLCNDSPLPQITAVGNKIEWYADAALTQLLGTGNSYQLQNLNSERIYVIQQNTYCKSPAAVTELNSHPKPAPPVASSAEACPELKKDFPLKAEGNNLRWYADQELENLLGEGESFQPEEMVNRTYFVTQSSDYCESDPAKVDYTTKTFDPSKAFFANVITPNGDEYNQYFYVKTFETEECLGKFIAVKIYNRMGKMLFQSSERSFNWDAGSAIPGIYFYSLEYELKKFNGHVQVIR